MQNPSYSSLGVTRVNIQGGLEKKSNYSAGQFASSFIFHRKTLSLSTSHLQVSFEDSQIIKKQKKQIKQLHFSFQFFSKKNIIKRIFAVEFIITKKKILREKKKLIKITESSFFLLFQVFSFLFYFSCKNFFFQSMEP
jgi:hypothetical protein